MITHKQTFRHWRFIASFVLAIGCSLVSMAQNFDHTCPTQFFPLTAQQIDNIEDNQFYVHFDKAFFNKWQDYIFKIIQHTTPVKSINLTLFKERMVYDEPTMVEQEKVTINHNGDYFEFTREFTQRPRVWENISLCSYNSYFGNAIEPLIGRPIIDAKGQKEKTTDYNASISTRVLYERDAKNRVTKATVNYKERYRTPDTGVVKMIIIYTYEPNSDYISDIKCYNSEGKIVAEVKYNYLTTAKQLLLSTATYQSYEYTHKGKLDKERYAYIFYYNSNEVTQVDLIYTEGWGQYAKTESNTVNVNIVRDAKGNIKQCTCKGNKRMFTWCFTYDENNNWISMTREERQSSDREFIKLVREFTFDKSKPASPASQLNNNPSPKANNSTPSQSVSIGHFQNQVVVIDGSKLRLRLGPSTSSDTFKWPDGTNRHPNVGDRLKYLGESGDFYKIDFNGNELWVSKQFSHIE